MKGYACLLWGLSLAVLGEGSWYGIRHPKPSSVCPKYGSRDPLVLPHEKCSHFHVCVAGKETVMRCPPGQHFNKRLQLCDHPHRAGCEIGSGDSLKWAIIAIRSRLKDAPFSLLALIPSSAIKANNLSYGAALKTIRDSWIKRQQLRKKFHEAFGGKRDHRYYTMPFTFDKYPKGSREERLQAASIKVFNDIKAQEAARTSKYPKGPYDPQLQKVWTGLRHTHRVAHTDGRPVLTCPRELEGRTLRNEHDCKTYYTCDNGIKKLSDCPPNTFFDPGLRRCSLNGKWFC